MTKNYFLPTLKYLGLKPWILLCWAPVCQGKLRLEIEMRETQELSSSPVGLETHRG